MSLRYIDTYKQLLDIALLELLMNVDDRREYPYKRKREIAPRITLEASYTSTFSLNYEILFEIKLLIDEKYALYDFRGGIESTGKVERLDELKKYLENKQYRGDYNLQGYAIELNSFPKSYIVDIYRFFKPKVIEKYYVAYDVPDWVRREIDLHHYELQHILTDTKNIDEIQRKINNQYMICNGLDANEQNTMLALIIDVLTELYNKGPKKKNINREIILEVYRYLSKYILPNIGYKIEKSELEDMVFESARKLEKK